METLKKSPAATGERCSSAFMYRKILLAREERPVSRNVQPRSRSRFTSTALMSVSTLFESFRGTQLTLLGSVHTRLLFSDVSQQAYGICGTHFTIADVMFMLSAYDISKTMRLSDASGRLHRL